MDKPNGVYALNPEGGANKPPTVLVHPTLNSSLFQYLENLDRLIATHKGPIITLDGVDTFDSTFEELKRRSNGYPRYFIKTLPSGPIPTEMGFLEMLGFITSFPGRPVGLAGVYSTGCVKVVLDRLSSRGVEARILTGLSYNGFHELE